jgi:preprotein translocase subunit SecB
MTPETKDQIKQASDSLKILDVVLFESKFERPERDPGKLDREGMQQLKREVQFFQPDDEDAFKDGKRYLQVLVSLGVRVVASEGTEEDKPVFFIEADFLVNYQMSNSLDAECIKAFSNHNSVHNVWPFWRQHVYDVIARSRLPHIDIPLYSVTQ